MPAIYMNSSQTTFRLISLIILPLLIMSIFFALITLSPIHYYLIWLLIIGIIINWIAWRVWGGIVSILSICIITLYAWMITGNGKYIIEIIPALIIFSLLYSREERIKKAITIKKLELDEKERSYNLLIQEHKKQEDLRESYYKKAKRFSRLSQIVKELGFTLAPEEINRNIISNLTKTIENGDIYLLYGVSSDLQNLELLALESPSGILPTETPPLDEFNMWIMRHRQPLIVTDVSKDYRFNTETILSKTRTRSLIISPLITGDRLLGILRIDSYRPDTFTIDDLRLLAIISSISALTIYNAHLYKQTEYLAIRDDLTGLYVKSYFNERLEKLITESLLLGKSFSILLLDLDRFKDINDQFGHSIGDRLLQRTAQLIQEGSGQNSIVARYGGEEFAIILPDTTRLEAKNTAERIKTLIGDYRFSIRREGVSTTVSIGLAEFPKEANTSTQLLDIADKRLYEAKRGGRNRVVWE